MKKFFAIIVASLLAVSAYAQFGVIGGLTSTMPDAKSAYENIKGVNLYHVGVTCKIGGNFFAIQPSLIYRMKGTSIQGVGEGEEATLDYKTGYVELPIQAQLGFALGSIARIYGIAEPYIGYAVTNFKKDESGNFENDIKSVTDKLEYGFGAGVGVELFKHFQLSVRYCWDFGEIGNKIDLAQVAESVKTTKCNCINASLAILF